MWFKNLRIYNIKFDLNDFALDAALNAGNKRVSLSECRFRR